MNLVDQRGNISRDIDRVVLFLSPAISAYANQLIRFILMRFVQDMRYPIVSAMVPLHTDLPNPKYSAHSACKHSQSKRPVRTHKTSGGARNPQ